MGNISCHRRVFGLPESSVVHVTQLEEAIISHLQRFLLEMGKGCAFVARQEHIRTEWSDFYIDRVFYNYIPKCFVLVDFKVGKITHQDVGQMDMYVRMYDDLKRGGGDNLTLGIYPKAMGLSSARIQRRRSWTT